MKKEEFIEEVGRILKERGESYGGAVEVHQDIADMWTIILGFPVSPANVANMMIALKLIRNSNQPKDDNWLDIAGYAAIGMECTTQSNVVNYEDFTRE